jgi:hypothetical protein
MKKHDGGVLGLAALFCSAFDARDQLKFKLGHYPRKGVFSVPAFELCSHLRLYIVGYLHHNSHSLQETLLPNPLLHYQIDLLEPNNWFRCNYSAVHLNATEAQE